MELLENKIGFYKFKPAKNKSKGTIVFIHGFGTNSDYHDEAGILFKNYDYYTIELPGHGYTKLEGDHKNILNMFVNFCISMIEFLSLENIILIGHSMGGALAIRISNIISNKVKLLIVVSPMNSYISFGVIKLFFLLTPKTFNETLSLNNVLYKDITKTIDLNIENYVDDNYKYQLENINFFKKLKHNLYSFKNINDCRRNEKKLSIKTLLIISEFDNVTPYKGAIKSIKRSNKPFIQVSIFRNSGHLPFKEELENYYKEIIDFIE